MCRSLEIGNNKILRRGLVVKVQGWRPSRKERQIGRMCYLSWQRPSFFGCLWKGKLCLSMFWCIMFALSVWGTEKPHCEDNSLPTPPPSICQHLPQLDQEMGTDPNVNNSIWTNTFSNLKQMHSKFETNPNVGTIAHPTNHPYATQLILIHFSTNCQFAQKKLFCKSFPIFTHLNICPFAQIFCTPSFLLLITLNVNYVLPRLIEAILWERNYLILWEI